MPFIDYATCEPLRIWDRLEPRARRVDFDEALQSRVHDPLWSLSRQWQMGEFKGEDTGSAVLAKLARQLTPVSAVAVGDGNFESEDLSLPAEARVERLTIEFPLIARARLGRRFLGLLDDEAAAHPSTGAPYDGALYRALFRDVYGIDAPAAPGPGDPVATARARVDARARRVAGALAGNAVDGAALYADLRPGMAVDDLNARLAAGIVGGQEDIVLGALERYRRWFDELYPPAPPAEASGWDGAKLEYRAACRLPREEGTLTLTVDEHVTGRLDWSAFDQGGIDPPGASASSTELRSVIPAPAEFAGMPNPRWWQLEDAAVDLGTFRANASDLAKIVVAEFALVYGNNWLVVPYPQPIGTLAEIEGVAITDVFGHRTLVGAATTSSAGKWTAWDMFSLSPRGTNAAAASPLPEHLFLPACLGTVLEAPPHETVALVRDEAADMVWGVERRIPDGLGASQDGTQVARRFTDELAAQWPPEPEPAPGDPTQRYVLGTEVPESWIPFLPVHKPADTREIRMQRAAMPRFVPPTTDPDNPALTQHVRPRTSILRLGVSEDDESADPYFVNEDEVPRAGINVNGALRRARWLNGRTVVWHGRTVVSGRGETDSGLRFDVVKPKDPRP
jgi:hypothetical protein